MFFERKVLRKIRHLLGRKGIIVVTGMRQVGKTTVLKMIFDEIQSKNKVFLDLENPILQKIFEEENYDNIWANLKAYGMASSEPAFIFLDEIQAMPAVVKAVKYLFDHYDAHFFLTGSSSFYLKNLFPESLAGRKIIFDLFPLDFEEFLLFKGEKKIFYENFKDKEKNKNKISHALVSKHFEEFINYGGFPKVALTEEIEGKKAVLEDIFKSYFEKEVRTLADFKNVNVLRDFILLLMQRTGSKLNISNISSEQGINRETAYSFLYFLELTYFLKLVPPFSRNKGTEVSGAKKVYFCDNGILSHFAKISSGALLENAVFNCIKTKGTINYYQKRSGREIDFILKNESTALEVKENGSTHDIKKLSKQAEKLKLKEHYVITKNFTPEKGFITASDL
ncbi:MAG: ATP-binding protein [Candidatus Diapherotrites archaeon]